jgi:hypothetical protein
MYLLLRLLLYLLPLLVVGYTYTSIAHPSLMELNLRLWNQLLDLLEVLGGLGEGSLPIGTPDLALPTDQATAPVAPIPSGGLGVSNF